MNFKSELHKIKAFAFDVDGVLTAGDVLVNESGELLRSFNTKDGYALRYAVSRGFKIAIITGGNSDTIVKRFGPLGISDIFMSSHDKLPDFHRFLSKYELEPDEAVFMGDDIPDICVMQICGMPVCPADAVPEVKAASKYISNFEGGKGCVRDIIEQVLKVQNQWMRTDVKVISG